MSPRTEDAAWNLPDTAGAGRASGEGGCGNAAPGRGSSTGKRPEGERECGHVSSSCLNLEGRALSIGCGVDHLAYAVL